MPSRKKIIAVITILIFLLIYIAPNKNPVNFIHGFDINKKTNDNKKLKDKNLLETEESSGAGIKIDPIELMPLADDMGDVQLPIGSTVVDTYEKLKIALENKDITTIYLGADIEITTGINTNVERKTLVIDGVNPFDPSKKTHTLIEKSETEEGNFFSSIYVYDGKLKDITIQNINITGKNAFGPVAISDSAQDVIILYENVVYEGPQITRNFLGTAIYSNSHITIHANEHNATSRVLARVPNVKFRGNVVIEHDPSDKVFSCFWILGTHTSFIVEEGADVSINTTARIVTIESPLGTLFTVSKNAKITMNTKKGTFYYDGGEQRFSDVTVEEGASLTIIEEEIDSTHAGDYRTATLQLLGTLSVKEGASLKLISLHDENIPLIKFKSNNNPKIFFTKSKNVLLYNKKGKIFDEKSYIHPEIKIEALEVNLWNKTSDYDSLVVPNVLWSLLNGENLTTTINLEGITTKKIVFDPIAYHGTNNNVADAKVFFVRGENETGTRYNASASNITFKVSDISSLIDETLSSKIIALSNPILKNAQNNNILNATPYIISKEFDSHAGNGMYNVVIGFLGTDINQASVSISVTITDGELIFKKVPQIVSFKQSSIPVTETIIERGDDWDLIISDTRGKGSKYELRAAIEKDFESDGGHSLPDSLVFKNQVGDSVSLSKTSITVFENTVDAITFSQVSWIKDRGILLKVNPYKTRANVEYKATIIWELHDVPFE